MVRDGWEDGSSCWDDDVGISIGAAPDGRPGFAIWRWDTVGYWPFVGTAEQVKRLIDHVTQGQPPRAKDLCGGCGVVRQDHGPHCAFAPELAEQLRNSGQRVPAPQAFVEPFAMIRDLAGYHIRRLG
jgi:hypothetical protein